MDDKGFLSTEDYPYHTAGPECVVYNYTCVLAPLRSQQDLLL